MIRQEHSNDKAYHVLASSALSAKSFIVFKRASDSIVEIPKKIGEREIIFVKVNDFQHVSSTYIRSQIQSNNLESIQPIVWLDKSQIILLDEYTKLGDSL